MPRTGRIVLPNYPHHVYQRGHDRNIVFVCDADYQYYLSNLSRFKAEFGVKVYAYCLMTNHVHLLLQPSDKHGLSLLMKRLAGRQTRYRNKKEERRGTLWEGRFKSSPVDSSQYLKTCIRYIELNPVRAKMVVTADEFAWSSCHARLKNNVQFLDPIPGLDITDEEPKKYLQFIAGAVEQSQLKLIREAVHRGQLTGGVSFVDQIDRAIGRRIEYRKPGRPRAKSV